MRHEFTGNNGQEIVDALNTRPGNNKPQSKAEVNESYSGASLSLNKSYQDADGFVAEDVWRIPRGYFIDDETGEVSDVDGNVQDYEDLVKM